MNEVIKTWLEELYSTAIKEAKATIRNEHIWELGYSGEEPNPHTENIQNLREYIETLEAKQKEISPLVADEISFDKLCHKVFAAKGNGTDFLSRETGVSCGYCGHELKTYCCESRLYVAECPCCKTRALVMAGNAKEAAYKTFGHAVYPIDEMDEEKTAVFFAHTPIDEPPCYVGSTIDCDFPKGEVVYGMYLPCPGTDEPNTPKTTTAFDDVIDGGKTSK